MVWEPKETEILISIMKRYPILRNGELYRDEYKFDASVSVIERTLKKPWKQIKQKWCLLKYYYTNSKPQWKFYAMMKSAIEAEYHQDSMCGSDRDEDTEQSSTFQGVNDNSEANKSLINSFQSRQFSADTINRPRRRSESYTPRAADAIELPGGRRMQETDTDVLEVVRNSYLDTISFKLSDIERKFGSHEAKVAAFQLHECICRFEKDATLRLSQRLPIRHKRNRRRHSWRRLSCNV